MAHHDKSVTASPSKSGNGDRAMVTGPLLLDGRVPRELLVRMQRYCVDVREHGYTADRLGLTEACEAVIRAVQAELRVQEPGPVPRDLAYELVISENWALHALVDWKGLAGAKREHIRIAGGRPLAICRGGGVGREVETVLGPMHAVAEGCLRVFEPPTRASGRMWPGLCPQCRPRNGKRNPTRDAERRVRARAREIANLRPDER